MTLGSEGDSGGAYSDSRSRAGAVGERLGLDEGFG